ncbi:MAG: HEAT repeat domain-containing protein [Acidobacteriota bacterium]|nr:HEAT repeat domain-containing protein [Acidobacteriota bacterium]
MRGRVFFALCDVRNPVVASYLEHFAESTDPHIRFYALMSLRAIGSLRSAPVFLRELDDHRDDMDFIAMQSLIELAGGGVIDWIPEFEQFSVSPDLYVSMCRSWWRTEGESKARARERASTNE